MKVKCNKETIQKLLQSLEKVKRNINSYEVHGKRNKDFDPSYSLELIEDEKNNKITIEINIKDLNLSIDSKLKKSKEGKNLIFKEEIKYSI